MPRRRTRQQYTLAQVDWDSSDNGPSFPDKPTVVLGAFVFAAATRGTDCRWTGGYRPVPSLANLRGWERVRLAPGTSDGVLAVLSR